MENIIIYNDNEKDLLRPVWIVSDSCFGEGCGVAAELNRFGIGSTLVFFGDNAYSSFTSALDTCTPVYAIWALKGDFSGFISLCKAKGVTPILTVLPGLDNEAVRSCGERFIDLASVVDGCDEEDLAITAYAKLLADFPEIITPKIEIRKAYAECLDEDDDWLSLCLNRIKDGKYLVFTARLDDLDEDGVIKVGHGHYKSYGAWMEITADKLTAKKYHDWHEVPCGEYFSVQHGLTLKNYITLIISCDADNKGNNVTLVTDGGVFTKSGYGWGGSEGEIFASVEDAVIRDVKLSWTCSDYDKKIWCIGASYFSLGDPARWPYYMYKEGYSDKILITGRGGMNTTHGLEELYDALKFGKPEYLVWGIGMNDGKDEGEINPKYYENIIKVLDVCKAESITPIIFNMPNCKVCNSYKLDYLMNRKGNFANYDYRVIDITRSVGAFEYQAENFNYETAWYPGALSKDGVHPTRIGAKNFYMQIMCDVPELFLGVDSHVENFRADRLEPSASLVGTEATSDEYAFTFTADLKGKFRGIFDIGTQSGTRIAIDENSVAVCDGEFTLKTVDNQALLKKYITVKVHVRGNVATISVISSTLKEEFVDSTPLFTFECDWTTEGKIFARAREIPLLNASLNVINK